MQSLFNLPVQYEGNLLLEYGIAFLNPNTDLYELNWIGLLTYGFVASKIQWNDDEDCHEAVWVSDEGNIL